MTLNVVYARCRDYFQSFLPSGWTIVVAAIALILASPVLVILSHLFVATEDVWQHLAETVLIRYLLNTLWLALGVGFGVILIGVPTAWLATLCEFPGRAIWEWALLLPMAAPAYVLAYVYTDWLETSGPVQTYLRHLFGWDYGDYWFPPVRSLPGAIVMLVLVLYPYVYLLARLAFLEQATCTLEASRTLGCSPWSSFFRVALPLSRPAITIGVALALMETLNDFGTVQYFGIDTFTTGIYRVWLALDERPASMQMSALLLLLVFGVLGLERWSRRQSRYYQSTGSHAAPRRYALGGWRSTLATIACTLPVLFGFLLPAGILCTLLLLSPDQDPSFWDYARHSLVLAGIAGLLAVVLALVMAYGKRLYPHNLLMRLTTHLAASGYAIPGSVIAVGILIPLNQLNNLIDQFAQTWFGFSTGLLFTGLVAVVFAYLVRFMTISMNTIVTSLAKIRPSLDQAARSLGYPPIQTLWYVHLPMLRSGMLTAAMLVFVDVMKELPATLIIRPFNFDTLAIRTYQLASDERLTEAASAALAIVLVGLIPVMIISRQITQSQHHSVTKEKDVGVVKK